METPKAKWKQEVEKLKEESDLRADSFLDKLKASKWTGAILLAAAVVVIVTLFTLS